MQLTYQPLTINLLHSRNSCVPAHPSPSSEAVCKPYKYGEKGVCSSAIGDRLIYDPRNNQELKEDYRKYFLALAQGVLSDRCVPTEELIYCNQFFKRCDNSSSIIRPVQVCREACEVMVQQHCKEGFRRSHGINKMYKAIHLMNCTALPRRNGGTIPECYYPRELKGIKFYKPSRVTDKQLISQCYSGEKREFFIRIILKSLSLTRL